MSLIRFVNWVWETSCCLIGTWNRNPPRDLLAGNKCQASKVCVIISDCRRSPLQVARRHLSRPTSNKSRFSLLLFRAPNIDRYCKCMIVVMFVVVSLIWHTNSTEYYSKKLIWASSMQHLPSHVAQNDDDKHESWSSRTNGLHLTHFLANSSLQGDQQWKFN